MARHEQQRVYLAGKLGYTNPMFQLAPRPRLLLAVAGLLLILFSLAALSYVLSPTGVSRERVPVAATLFVPPQPSPGEGEGG